MATELRETGISAVGPAPWGTHFCHFYQTKQDLLDTVVPYFKAGLENNEFCLWVISDSDLITMEEANRALAQAVPDLDRHLEDQNIEILNGQDWYFDKNSLNLERVKNAWDAKLKRALARGYDGMRASGDTFWLSEKDWKDFFAYEKQINEWITGQSMTVLCTYPLAKSGATEVLDVVRSHQFVIARRQGTWEVIETPELIEAKGEIKRLNEELEQRVIERTNDLKVANEELRNEIAERKRAESMLHAREQEFRAIVENAPDHIIRYDRNFRRTYVNPAVAQSYGLPAEALIGKPIGSVIEDAGLDVIEGALAEVRQRIADVFDTGQSYEYELIWPMPAGLTYFSVRLFPELDLDGSVVNVLGISRDITERRSAEEELKKEKEILEKVFDNIPVMIGFVGDNGRIKLVNSEWERTLGWTLKELEEQNVDIFAEAYPDLSYRQEVLDFVAASTGEWEDLKIKVRDGRLIDAACAVVHLSDGTKIAIARDITERKLADDALRRSDDHLRLVIDTIPTMAWSIRPDGSVDFVNQRWMDYTGLSLEEEIEEPTRPIHPEDVPKVIERWLVEREVGEPYEEEMRLLRADGEYRWFLVRTAPLRDEQGNLVKWYGVSIDIEDRKQAEEKLKHSENRLAEAQHLAHVGSWEWNLRNDTVTWSDELYRIFGLPPGEISAAGDAMPYIHPEDREIVKTTVNSSVKSKEPYSFYYRLLRPDGDERIVHSRGYVGSDESGEPIRVFGATQDVTELKRAEEKLRATSEQLRALSARLQSAREEEATRIAREIHDELGSSLTRLKWALQLIRNENLGTQDEVELRKLSQEVDEMIQLIDATIDTVRRIASELRPTVLDDLGLIPALRWETSQFHKRTGIETNFDSPLEGIDLTPQHSTAVYRIFEEALTNVMRHAQATRVDVELGQDNDELVLTIRDNGRGITVAEKADRRSLGLLSMRERANIIGGQTDITASEEGTTVTVRLPISGRP